jgi:hypothetical protein
MEPGALVLLAATFIAAIFFGILQLESEEEHRNAAPTKTSELATLAQLSGGTEWSVTIMRRSGYVHDEWRVTGTAKNAVDLAVSKLHQARIYDVRVRTNKPIKLDVVAFYESQGRRRTGKYIGGFVITPC